MGHEARRLPKANDVSGGSEKMNRFLKVHPQ
jgi:hypothetical protein